MRRAAFFDIDGTLTSENVWRGIMAYFNSHNLRRGTYAAFMLSHLPLYYLYKAGLLSELAFRTPWAANLAWFFRGMRIDEAEVIWDWVVEDFLNKYNYWRPDSCRLIGQHLAEDDIVMVVSSGPEPLIVRLAEEMEIPYAVGTRLEIGSNGRYTGQSLNPICIDHFKASLAKEHLTELGVSVAYEESFAYADSITDLQMLEMVGNPVAVYPTPALRVVAEQRGWEIFEQAKEKLAD